MSRARDGFGALVVVASVMTTMDARAADLALRGETKLVDAKKLGSLVDLELGTAGSVDKVLIELSTNRAAVVLERRDRPARSGTIDLPAGSDVERTIALFVGEVSREPEAQSAPVAPLPVMPVPTAEPPIASAPPEAARTFALLASAQMRRFPTGGAIFLGPSAGAELALGERVGVGVSARYLLASEDDVLGTVSSQWAGAGPSLTYAFLRREVWMLLAGASAEAGWLRGSGAGNGARSVSAFAFAVGADLESRWFVSRSAALVLGIDIGYFGPGFELHAGRRNALDASGPYTGIRLGFGYRF